MALSPGEQYSIFLLLTAANSNLRNVLMGIHDGSGAVLPKPVTASSPADMVTLATKALTDLGVAPGDLNSGLRLGALYDSNAKNKLTTDPVRISYALALNYSGDCPSLAVGKNIVTGLKGSLG